MAPGKKTVFNVEWLKDETLSPWLRENANDKFSAYCSFCKKNFSLSNMGIQSLTSHARSSKHSKIISIEKKNYGMHMFLNAKPQTPLVQDLVTGSSNLNNPHTSLSDYNSLVLTPDVPKSPILGEKNITTFFEKDATTKAEILWALQCVYSHLSMSAGGACIETMKLMFPDSNIASNIKLQRTKLTYTIVHGLAKHFLYELQDILKKVDCFTIAFDESLNKISEKEQMDIYIRYWDDEFNKVLCQYYTSTFLGHTTAEDMLDALVLGLQPLDLKHIMQVSMDGPNVNIKLLRLLKEKLKTSDLNDPIIIDIGTCGLHTLHNAFKAGIKAPKWEIIDFLRAIYNLFKNVPARRADLIHYSGSSEFPLKFCAVRWLQNIVVTERAEKLLPNLRAYVEGVKNTNREPTSYSYSKMVKGLSDPFIRPKLAYFKTIAAQLEPFLKQFQSDAPLGPYLYTDLQNILQFMMSSFVKPEIMEKEKITEIDVLDKTKLIGAKKINLGFSTREAIRSIDKFNDKDILIFRTDCQLILQTICLKLLVKSPIKYKMVKGISFCDPSIIVSSVKVANFRFKTTLEIFVENHWVSGIVGDKLEIEFSILCSNKSFIERAKQFSRNEVRLDSFWTNIGIVFNLSSAMMNVLKKVLIFSHGNASVERGFSVNKECLITNLKEESLIAQRHVWSAINKVGGISNIIISKKLILDVRNARQYYEDALKMKKKADSEHKEKLSKKKHMMDQLQQLREKKIRLMETAQMEVDSIEQEINELVKL